MTKQGHRLIAVAFATALSILMVNGTLPVTSIGDNSKVTIIYALLFSVGVMFGASVPDWLEVVRFVQGRRISLIAHRTLTHWLPIWCLALYWVSAVSWPWFVKAFIYGFVLSSMLHIVMDAFSKTGVPLLLPFRKYSVKLPLYTTGGLSEWVWSVVVLAIFVASAYYADKLVILASNVAHLYISI